MSHTRDGWSLIEIKTPKIINIKKNSEKDLVPRHEDIKLGDPEHSHNQN